MQQKSIYSHAKPASKLRKEFGGAIFLGSTQEIRIAIARRKQWAERELRQKQQAERGLVEFPFELLDYATGKVLKKIFTTEHDAAIRNNSIRSLGMAWRRSGY